MFNALKLKVASMPLHARQCALTFDEMSLKSALVYNYQLDTIEGFDNFGDIGRNNMATHALAFMVRGLSSKWKQPVGYFLSSGPVTGKMLQSLTRACIGKLTKIGLSVNVLIYDQGSNNRQFLDTFDKTHIAVDHHDIYVIYDPPHFLKNVRNNFVKHGFIVNKQSVEWQYVTPFYEFDQANLIRMAPKLQDKHITLPLFSAMRVNLGAQPLCCCRYIYPFCFRSLRRRSKTYG